MIVLYLKYIMQEVDVVYCDVQNLPPAHLVHDPKNSKFIELQQLFLIDIPQTVIWMNWQNALQPFKCPHLPLCPNL